MNTASPMGPTGWAHNRGAPVYRCWAEVDLDSLRDNLAWIRQRVGPGVRIMTVVKADAYGHGLAAIAAHLMRCGADLFGVANLAEAHAIRSVGRGWPVLMLGACLPDEVARAIRDGVMLTVSDETELRHIANEAARVGISARVHLKIDTGMGRLGCRPVDAVRLAIALERSDALRLEALYTHFAAAEDDAAFTRKQESRFRATLEDVRAAGIPLPLVHACNSGGLLHQPGAWFGLVRPGLLVYGILPPGKRRLAGSVSRGFRPALSLYSRVSLVRAVARGTTVSYGHTFTAPRAMRLATVSVGYGDGYPRAASGRAEVLVRGRRCPVVGRVTMDQTVVDVSAVPAVAAGDVATLLGRQGAEAITAVHLAEWCGTIPWEILTGISYRVPRVYRGAQAS